MKTQHIPAELLFHDPSVGMRLDVAELDERIELAPMNGPMGLLLMNGTVAAVFCQPIHARAFGMQMETSRALANLRDAAHQLLNDVATGEPEKVRRLIAALHAQVSAADEVLRKNEEIAMGGVPGRVTQ